MQAQNVSQHLKQLAYWYDAVTKFISWIFFSLYIYSLFYSTVFFLLKYKIKSLFKQSKHPSPLKRFFNMET